MRLRWLAPFILLFWLVAWPAWAEVVVPPLNARVTDLTQTLDAASKQSLEAKLAALEQAKGAQIAVLIVAATQPESIEQYALRVVETWKLGRKGVDDGALLLVAKEERALRIEVGYGLEGAIPDAVAKRIIAEIIVPRFQAGDFSGGLAAGVDALIKQARGEALPAPRSATPSGIEADWLKGLGDALPMVMMFIFVLGSLLRLFFGRLLGAGVAGAVAFLGAWLLLGGLLVGLVVALMAFLFVLLGGRAGGRHYGGVGGGMGGGGFGGGGFGGGGGGFGGGGASGRW